MRFGSVCSGIEAASVAWNPLGWEAAWVSEIEPFPCAVLAHHYPDVPNLGDMTLLPEKIKSGEVEAPDVFCGGTPCQSFSVAGKRQSLGDARGNLSLTFCEIANAIDDIRGSTGQQPTIIFWENVPGVLSAADNAFGCFLGELAGESVPIEPSGGKWTNAGCVFGPQRTVAWRVFDAQYFGVAQRRRRVFVVASARDGFDPAAVLFEFEGMRRDTAPSREAGQGTTHATAQCFDRQSSGEYGTAPVASTMSARDYKSAADLVAQPIAFQSVDHGADATVDLSPTIRSHDPMAVAQPVAYAFDGLSSNSMKSANPNSGCNKVDVSKTLDTSRGLDPSCNQGGIGVAQPIAYAIMPMNSGKDYKARETEVAQPIAFRETADCLTAGYGTNWNGNASADNGSLFAGHSHAVAQPMTLAPTLTASNDPSRSPQSTEITNQVASVYAASMAVRRLTPVECERLQGFPDNYTNIPWRKKDESPDGPRYKALGNSWAVPNVRWIGKRIQAAIEPS